MGKCLVTKLNGTIDNKSIRKLGELKLSVKETESSLNDRKLSVVLENAGSCRLTNGNILSSTGTSMGDITAIEKKKYVDIYFDNINSDVFLSSKYDLSYIKSNFKGLLFGLDELKYTKVNYLSLENTQVYGDVSAFESNQLLTTFNVKNTKVSGNLNVFKDMLTLKSLILTGTQITGDIANMLGMSSLKSLSASFTNITGNIADLSGMNELGTIELAGTLVTGNIADLSGMNNLNYLNINHSHITGDISLLMQNKKEGSILATNTTLSWKQTRPSSSYILAIEDAVLEDVDAMLINQANCQVGFISSSGPGKKMIKVSGTRTSASDAAVATLQQKGYTISIAKA